MCITTRIKISVLNEVLGEEFKKLSKSFQKKKKKKKKKFVEIDCISEENSVTLKLQADFLFFSQEMRNSIGGLCLITSRKVKE